MTPGFDPDRDLQHVGVANQTTMLSGESLAIAAEVAKKHERTLGCGVSHRALPHLRHDLFRRPRSGRTPCSSSSPEPLDLMVVIGGYNSAHDPPRGHLP